MAEGRSAESLSIRGWFTSFVKIQGINVTICHALLCTNHTSCRCKHFRPMKRSAPLSPSVSQRYVMRICKCWLVISCRYIFTNTVVCQKKYRFDLIFRWACGFNQNISRFSTTWVRGEASRWIQFVLISSANWSKWCLPHFKTGMLWTETLLRIDSSTARYRWRKAALPPDKRQSVVGWSSGRSHSDRNVLVFLGSHLGSFPIV